MRSYFSKIVNATLLSSNPHKHAIIVFILSNLTDGNDRKRLLQRERGTGKVINYILKALIGSSVDYHDLVSS